MATIDQKRLIIAENLTQELPRRLDLKLSKIQIDTDDKEKNDVNYVFNKVSDEIYETLNHYLKIDSRTAQNLMSRILEENKYNVVNAIKKSRQDLNGCISYNLKQVIMRENSLVQESAQDIGIEESFSVTDSRIENGFDNDVKNSDDKKDIDKKSSYKIQDILRTEMKSQIKRMLYQYNRQGEEATYEISRIIDNKLVPKIEEKYYENTDEIYNRLKIELNNEFEEIKNKCINEYNNELENEGNNKDKKELDFSDLVYKPGEEPERKINSEDKSKRIDLESLFK
jgi:hypothetical protein